MGGQQAEVAVVLVTTNCRGDVERNLAELRAQEGVRLELVAVDNASTDGTRELLAAQPDVTLIANRENRWLSPAWAQGVRSSSAPYVLLLTPDTSLPPDLLRQLKQALDERPEAALAGPRLVGEDGHDQLNGGFSFPSVPWILLSALGLAGLFRRDRPPAPRPHAGETRTVPFVNGACLLVRRSALEEIGGLDERYLLYWEEVDLARRLQQAGFAVLLVQAVDVVHRGKGTPMRTGLRREVWAHGERLYLRTHHGLAADLVVRGARVLERLRRAAAVR